MKILILSHSSDFSGAERSMLDIADHWRKTSHITIEFIINMRPGPLRKELKKRSYRYYPIDYTNWAQRNPSLEPLHVYWNAKRNNNAISKIEDILIGTNPDLLITNTIIAPWLAIAANKHRLPHIWFVREYAKADSGITFTTSREKTFTDIGYLSDLIATNSCKLKEDIKRLVQKTPVAAVYTPFNIAKINKLAQERITVPYRYENSLKVVVVGRIAETKGQHIAAEAIGVLRSRGYDVELCLVGGPTVKGDSSKLLKVIKKYRIEDRVIMMGNQQNVLPFIKASDLAIAPSLNEAFGRTTFEYLALSKPVVGAKSGATPELIRHNHNGLLYSQTSPMELADNIETYYQDRRLLIQHGGNGREIADGMMNGDCSAKRFFARLPKVILMHGEKAPYNLDWLSELLMPPKYIRANGVRGFAVYLYQKATYILRSAVFWLLNLSVQKY